MLKFFKPKMTVDDLALIFARVVVRILSPSMNPKIAAREAEFTAVGASPTFISHELAAFGAFNIWSGSVLALQKAKISTVHWELFHNSFSRQLKEILGGSEADNECLTRWGCDFSGFVDARMEVLADATQGVDISTAMLSIVNIVCGNLGRSDTPIDLMLAVKMSYLMDSGSAYDLISGTRLI